MRYKGGGVWADCGVIAGKSLSIEEVTYVCLWEYIL